MGTATASQSIHSKTDTQPQEDQPQGGDTNPAGAVYVPGFGYIESSGPNEQGTSHTDGDWDRQIGTMQ